MTPEQVSAAASVVTTIIAVVAVCVAKNQIAGTRKITREATATNLYNHCLEMCLQYPMLAEPALSGGFKKLVSKPETAACYAWFVASMLLSCEEILEVTNNESQWRASVSATLDGHTEYFRYRSKGHRPLSSFYSVSLMELIDELVANPGNPPQAQALQLSSSANA